MNRRTLHILKYLWEHTDESCPVTAAKLMEYLESKGLPVKDARTIRSDITDLCGFGIDIIEQRKQQYQYFIGNSPELRRCLRAPAFLLLACGY